MEAAELLSLSPKTVETYRHRAMQKLGLTNRAQLVRYALRAGLLGSDEV
ncbi:MAG TPA: LuxR C-terminal-related transcriptional regulator [Thermomicrobiales bacterium]|nr:LuxR C-terminal-related transcriptional regulator [Thermomicrobiales bacterium]